MSVVDVMNGLMHVDVFTYQVMAADRGRVVVGILCTIFCME